MFEVLERRSLIMAYISVGIVVFLVLYVIIKWLEMKGGRRK